MTDVISFYFTFSTLQLVSFYWAGGEGGGVEKLISITTSSAHVSTLFYNKENNCIFNVRIHGHFRRIKYHTGYNVQSFSFHNIKASIYSKLAGVKSMLENNCIIHFFFFIQ